MIAIISASAALAGYVLGAILAMIIDTMVPESFHETHECAGIIAVAGFVVAFAMAH